MQLHDGKIKKPDVTDADDVKMQVNIHFLMTIASYNPSMVLLANISGQEPPCSLELNYWLSDLLLNGLSYRPIIALPEYRFKVFNICEMHGTGGAEVKAIPIFRKKRSLSIESFLIFLLFSTVVRLIVCCISIVIE